MWRLAKPGISAEIAFLTCISRIRTQELKIRLQSVRDLIVSAADELEEALEETNAHQIAQSADVGGLVTQGEMEDVYTYRMARSGSAGRKLYDQILSAPAHGRCPLCGHRLVTTLDHYLPKAFFPALAVAPINLIPCCTDCNKTKLDAVAQTPEELTLHPYFDLVENDWWLKAEVLEKSPAVVKFFADPPQDWDELTRARVRSHFKTLKLGSLYTSQAAEELMNIRHNLTSLFAIGGAELVRNHLADKAESCAAARVNSWQRATYDALAGSQWFCEGGYSA